MKKLGIIVWVVLSLLSGAAAFYLFQRAAARSNPLEINLATPTDPAGFIDQYVRCIGYRRHSTYAIEELGRGDRGAQIPSKPQVKVALLLVPDAPQPHSIVATSLLGSDADAEALYLGGEASGFARLTPAVVLGTSACRQLGLDPDETVLAIVDEDPSGFRFGGYAMSGLALLLLLCALRPAPPNRDIASWVP